MFAPVARLIGHTADVIKGSFDTDRITTASADSTLKIWDIETVALLKSLANHACDVSDFKSSGALIISVAADGSRLWDTRTTSAPVVLTKDNLTSLALPGGNNMREITFSNREGEILCFDLIAGKYRCRAKAHRQSICNIYYGEDNSQFLTSGLDGVMRLWSTVNLECLASFSTPAKNKCLFSRFLSNSIVAGLFNDGSVRQWNLTDRIYTSKTSKGFNVGNSCKNFTTLPAGAIIAPNADGGIDTLASGDEQIRKSVRAHSDDASHVDFAINAMVPMIITCGYGLDCSAVIWREVSETEPRPKISFHEVFPQIVGL